MKEEVTNGEKGETAAVGSLIVDEVLLESLEKDVMPAGLESEEEEKVEEAAVKIEKVYHYEATTVRTLLLADSHLLTGTLTVSSYCVVKDLHFDRLLDNLFHPLID